jgi:hypothetical protein
VAAADAVIIDDDQPMVEIGNRQDVIRDPNSLLARTIHERNQFHRDLASGGPLRLIFVRHVVGHARFSESSRART